MAWVDSGKEVWVAVGALEDIGELLIGARAEEQPRVEVQVVVSEVAAW